MLDIQSLNGDQLERLTIAYREFVQCLVETDGLRKHVVSVGESFERNEDGSTIVGLSVMLDDSFGMTEIDAKDGEIELVPPFFVENVTFYRYAK